MPHSVFGAAPRLLASVLATALVAAGQAGAQSASAGGKVPITASSDSAREIYVKGRTLQENLRGHDARQFLTRAAAADPGFALAQYTLAQTAPTAKEFFEHLNQAVKLAGKVSEGERLMILGLQAGANADTKKQLEYYTQLVSKYPNDPRARFLLGGAYFGKQDYPKAIEEYQASVTAAQDYAPAYNLLGYAHRQAGQFPEAEKAFKKYIELIPQDPNPYDSYAELLMKMGRFDESIAMYRKALSVDPHFAPSFIGISTNLLYQGKHQASRAEAKKLYDAARDDGERRAAMFAETVAYIDEGKFDQAMKELDRQYTLGAKINDAAAMGGDAIFMGNVLLEAGKPDEALKRFEQAVKVQEASSLSQEVKDNAKLIHHYNLGRVALRKGDVAGAKTHADAFTKGTTALGNSFQIQLAHELSGSIALQEKDFERALSELALANQQDPYNLYRIGLAYEGKKDQGKAREMFQKAANINTLPGLNHGFVREKTRKMKVAAAG
jgi:tetratricopeptide (TPR) repeat protein